MNNSRQPTAREPFSARDITNTTAFWPFQNPNPDEEEKPKQRITAEFDPLPPLLGIIEAPQITEDLSEVTYEPSNIYINSNAATAKKQQKKRS